MRRTHKDLAEKRIGGDTIRRNSRSTGEKKPPCQDYPCGERKEEVVASVLYFDDELWRVLRVLGVSSFHMSCPPKSSLSPSLMG